jgi:hypothetical protein
LAKRTTYHSKYDGKDLSILYFKAKTLCWLSLMKID